MTNMVTIEATADAPKSRACWAVDVGEGTPEQQLAYVNFTYDIIALALGKLGLEYSKYMLGEYDAEQYAKVMNEVRASLL